MIVCYNDEYTHAYRSDIWEGYVHQVGINRMGGNPYTYQQIQLREEAGGPFGCIPQEYVTVLSEGIDFLNTILSSSGYTHTILGLIYSTLWRVDPLDPFSEAAPDLAYDWTIQPTIASGDIQEGLKYTFYLYENITWHDGTPFTSEDVQYSLMTVHPWGTYTADNVERIYRVDTPDNHTVEIYSNSTGYVDFTESTRVQILPKHIWSQYEAANFTWYPESAYDLTGTGCYRWGSRITGQEIVLDRYDGWHFAIEHPPRSTCPQPPSPPWFTMILVVGVLIILLQASILSIFLYRRRKGQLNKGEKSREDA
jgi:ABC-type transport system substrate-binding protein